jgi:hypothetical protein
MVTKRFYKDIDSWYGSEGWYIDLPEWPGSKAELAMVMGADIMLDMMAGGESEVLISFSNENFENAEVLTKLRDNLDIGGAHYLLSSYMGIEFSLELWLCDVTKFIFGTMPEKIYIKRIA